mgnify:CR=1 FL=1
MNDPGLEGLKQALSVSPDNIPLRLLYAQNLLKHKCVEESITQFQEILKKENHFDAKFGLATAFFEEKSYSKCLVLLESITESNLEILLLRTNALVEDNSIMEAIEQYKLVLELDPHYTNEYLDDILRVASQPSGGLHQEEEEDILDSVFIQKPDINFSNVGGMENVKKEIDLKIIQPLLHPEIYKAYGKKIGGGILLYGPPGCGKTYIAKATAGQINAKFINVSLSDILEMWMGNSEKNLHEVFETARANTPCVLFFDEIDALGASRSDMQKSSSRHLINQFLLELDGIDNKNDGILVLGATNTPWHLDSAFKRPGRFDRVLFVPPPDLEARKSIFDLKLSGKPTKGIKSENLAKKSKEFSGADIEATIDRAIEGKLEEAIAKGVPSPLLQKDFEKAIKAQVATTKDWFVSAKNYALYSNQSGFYDEILTYMKIKK